MPFGRYRGAFFYLGQGGNSILINYRVMNRFC